MWQRWGEESDQISGKVVEMQPLTQWPTLETI